MREAVGMGLRRHPRLQDARRPHHPGRGHGDHDRHRHELHRGRPERARWPRRSRASAPSVIFIRPFGPGENLSARGVAAAQGPHRWPRWRPSPTLPVGARRSPPWSSSRVETIKYGNEKVQDAPADRHHRRPTRPSTTPSCERGRFISDADVNRAVARWRSSAPRSWRRSSPTWTRSTRRSASTAGASG